MPLLSRILLLLLTLALAAPAAALSDCPGIYAGKSCLGYCGYDSGDDEYQCDDFSSSADKLWLVSDGTKVWAWGRRNVGLRDRLFCCSYSHGGTVPHAYVIMGNGADQVRLHYGTDDYESTSFISGGGGTDNIEGSRYDGCDYPCDIIWPGDGADTVKALAGNDRILSFYWESTDGKTLEGGEGHDKIVGSGGADTIKGGEGDDWLQGGEDGDTIEGGDDQDTLWGQAGQDSLYTNAVTFGYEERMCAQAGSEEHCEKDTENGYHTEFYCDCISCGGLPYYGDDTCTGCGSAQEYHGDEECPTTALGFWAP